MKCEQFEARWQQLLDDRLPVSSDPYLMAHCLTCESCAAQVAATESVLFALEYDIPELDEEFAQRVVASATVTPSISSTTSQPATISARVRRGGWSVPWGPMVIAAAALTVIVSFTNAPWWNSPSPTDSVAKAPANLHRPARQHDLAAIASVDELATNEQAMQEMQALLVELARKFPRDEAAKMLSDHMQRLDNVARPVAYSVGTAITAIYRSVGNSRPNKSAQSDWPAPPSSYS